MNNYIVFDCETGGLDPEKNPITEIALIAVRGEDFTEVARYESFIQPYGQAVYDKKALELTGITMDMINGGQPHATVIKELIDFFKSVKRKGRLKPIMVAHNAAFDQGMIEFAFHVANKNLYEYVDPIFMDTMTLSRLRDPLAPKHTLSAFCERFGVEVIGAHRAVNDVEATIEAMKKYFMGARGEGVAVAAKEVSFRENFKF